MNPMNQTIVRLAKKTDITSIYELCEGERWNYSIKMPRASREFQVGSWERFEPSHKGDITRSPLFSTCAGQSQIKLEYARSISGVPVDSADAFISDCDHWT